MRYARFILQALMLFAAVSPLLHAREADARADNAAVIEAGRQLYVSGQRVGKPDSVPTQSSDGASAMP